ncbi:hypothetical protein B0H17DRAFT_1283783 [Mycena rosella]|uniref:Uncharacterized protein n=1 Tax=Mycena rosella TaxID=1033263 RepID=A0AAD7BSX0_MYCRO|nr:hypothetical protein B0H17DRAFT_1283783 [Mycena rosella]
MRATAGTKRVGRDVRECTKMIGNNAPQTFGASSSSNLDLGLGCDGIGLHLAPSAPCRSSRFEEGLPALGVLRRVRPQPAETHEGACQDSTVARCREGGYAGREWKELCTAHTTRARRSGCAAAMIDFGRRSVQQVWMASGREGSRRAPRAEKEKTNATSNCTVIAGSAQVSPTPFNFEALVTVSLPSGVLPTYGSPSRPMEGEEEPRRPPRAAKYGHRIVSALPSLRILLHSRIIHVDLGSEIQITNEPHIEKIDKQRDFESGLIAEPGTPDADAAVPLGPCTMDGSQALRVFIFVILENEVKENIPIVSSKWFPTGVPLPPKQIPASGSHGI